MILEYAIARREIADSDRAKVQEEVAHSVETDSDHYLALYKKDFRSFNGRYICADLFKEMFDVYNASKESRNLYNVPVHNSAAVLAARLFMETVKDSSFPERDTAVFLTGIPGAGKTSSVLVSGDLPPNYKLIFEGQLSNPKTTFPKIQSVLDAGLKPLIIAVHATPENALENTFKRFHEEGRGAGIGVMADIQAGLPTGLREVYGFFGDNVQLRIVDYRDRNNRHILMGWEHLNVFESEGNHECIKQRLIKRLEHHYLSGNISESCYRQACGKAPVRRESVDAEDAARHEPNVDGRGISQGDSQQTVIADSMTPKRHRMR